MNDAYHAGQSSSGLPSSASYAAWALSATRSSVRRRSSIIVVSFGRSWLERSPWLIAPARSPDGQQRHPVRAGHWTACRLRVEPEEVSLAHGHLGAVDAVVAGPADHDGDLLLPGRALVVHAPLGVRRQLDPVDAERLDAQ